MTSPRYALDRLRRRPDFQQSPVIAIGRRIWWRIRWTVTDEPWHLRLSDGLRLTAPRSGACALIYYLGQSEPEVAAFLKRTLKAGMIFWDIGAHIGEYSLLASQWVGNSGHVEAFEPQPEIFEFLSRNVAENELRNVTLHRLAISDREGCRRMSVHPEPSQSFLSPENAPADSAPSIEVSTTSIDELLRSGRCVPNVLKVDAEGAETMILDGAITLLELPEEAAPIWVMEFEPDTCVRFGYHPGELVRKLVYFGFNTYWVLPEGDLLETSHSSSYPFGRTIVASKRALPC